MKKILVFVLLSLFIATMFTGCGDDDNDTTAPTPNDLEDLNFVMSIANVEDDYNSRSEELWVMVYPLDYSTTINEISLTINGQTIELEFEEYGGNSYFGYLDAEAGDALNCQLIINGTTADLQLQVPAYPEVDWPEVYDPASVHDITWELELDSQYQFLSGYAETYDWDNWETIDEDENMLDLSPSARFTNLPANWLKPGLEDYDLSLEEIFFDYDGKMAGVAVAINSEYYWEYRAGNQDRDDLLQHYQQRAIEIARTLRK